MIDLYKYFKENKDGINSSIMEIAGELAAARLMNEHDMTFESFVEPDDPDDPESGTHYNEEFQDEYNEYYDAEYNRVASLVRFDIDSDDGLAHKGIDSKVTETKTAYVMIRPVVGRVSGGKAPEKGPTI